MQDRRLRKIANLLFKKLNAVKSGWSLPAAQHPKPFLSLPKLGLAEAATTTPTASIMAMGCDARKRIMRL
jgi:hypothetical protein